LPQTKAREYAYCPYREELAIENHSAALSLNVNGLTKPTFIIKGFEILKWILKLYRLFDGGLRDGKTLVVQSINTFT
jgi:hypothetical protein